MDIVKAAKRIDTLENAAHMPRGEEPHVMPYLPIPDKNAFVNAQEFCRLLGIRRKTLMHWVELGLPRYFRGRSYSMIWGEALEWIKKMSATGYIGHPRPLRIPLQAREPLVRGICNRVLLKKATVQVGARICLRTYHGSPFSDKLMVSHMATAIVEELNHVGIHADALLLDNTRHTAQGVLIEFARAHGALASSTPSMADWTEFLKMLQGIAKSDKLPFLGWSLRFRVIRLGAGAKEFQTSYDLSV